MVDDPEPGECRANATSVRSHPDGWPPPRAPLPTPTAKGGRGERRGLWIREVEPSHVSTAVAAGTATEVSSQRCTSPGQTLVSVCTIGSHSRGRGGVGPRLGQKAPRRAGALVLHRQEQPAPCLQTTHIRRWGECCWTKTFPTHARTPRRQMRPASVPHFSQIIVATNTVPPCPCPCLLQGLTLNGQAAKVRKTREHAPSHRCPPLSPPTSPP